jgi:hypothetical protein
MKSQELFVLCLACAFASATLLGATLISGYFLDWFQSLPASGQKFVQPVLALVTAVLLGLAGFMRYRNSESEE